MTAIVSILNKTAIAVAADSAATATNADGQSKIFSQHKKIFPLSCKQPIAIAIYGCEEFMDVPLEVLIQAYNREIRDKCFKTVEHCKQKFLSFLRTQSYTSSKDAQWEHVASELRQLYSELFESEDSADIILNICLKHGKQRELSNYQYELFLQDYCLLLDDIEKEFGPSLPNRAKFRKIAFEYLTVHSYDIDPHSYDIDPLEEGRAFKEQSLFACKQAAA